MSILLITLLWAGSQAGASPADLSGVWRIEHPPFVLKTGQGASPPLNPAGRKLYEQHTALRKAGDQTYDNTTWCASPGVPRIMLIDTPFEIIAHPRQVLFLYQWDRWARLVDLTGTPLEVVYPSSMGVSSGFWKDDALIINTKGLRGNTLLDNSGLPHSEDMKVIETLRLASHDVLENRIRIEDPRYYTRPWETRVTYHRQTQTEIHEDVCLDRIRTGEPAIRGG